MGRLLPCPGVRAPERVSAQVRLGVDSDNPTGAPTVYRRAGLEVLFAMHAWRKDLT